MLLDEASLRELLLGAILIDTSNLQGTSGRVTARDKRAADVARRDMSDTDATALYETLRAKRLDQSGLCTRDLLRRRVLWRRRWPV